MLYNFLKIGFRNLMRHKVFSLINVLGLALGMTCSLLILLWIQSEVSYDRFHKNLGQLYRVMEVQHFPGAEDLTTESTPSPLAPALMREFPEVKFAASTSWNVEELFTYHDKAFKENGLFASNDFLKIFSFPLLEGQADFALAQPHTVVISKKLAEKYFGEEPALGRVMRLNNRDSYKVTGVFANVPENSSLQFDFLMPVQDFAGRPENAWMKDWANNGLRTYVWLQPNADVKALNAKLEKYLHTKNPESRIDLFLQPFSEVYLYSDFRQGKTGKGRIEYVELFSMVAIFILVIACINFMNLSTARSAKRAKEVGVKKVIGVPRYALIGQFLGESMLIAFLACMVSVNLAQILLPGFNALTGKELVIDYQDPVFIFSLLGITVFTGILSGSYPAFFLASFNPVSVLKGTLKYGRKVIFFRRGLVVFQFILSAVFIICTLVVYKQIHFIKNKNLGLDRNNVIYLPREGELKQHFETFKKELLSHPEFTSVSASDQKPVQIVSSTGGVEWDGKEKGSDVLFSTAATDFDYLKTLDIQLKEGRDFSPEFSTDTANYLVNEEAARLMHLPNPVGKKITIHAEGTIIGVFRNFHSHSMHVAMQPLILQLKPEKARMMYVRIKPGHLAAATAVLQELNRKYNPAYPFEYHFLNEDFERLYHNEAIIGKLATYFSGIAIFISLLGLFGLALFTAEQRTKEIGIRKVMGASVASIVTMLSTDFLKLVLLANVFALPLGWFLMQNWLQDFAFHTDLSWWIFGLACVATLLIALVTVSFHAIRTAIANPVNSLRSE